MIKKFIKLIISPFQGKKRYQRFFLFLNNLSLKGMNIGINIEEGMSGEVSALNDVKKAYKEGENFVLFDVGANVGEYSILLHDNFTNADIYAFEPAHSTFELLISNTNHLDNIHAFNLGLGEQNTSATLFSNPDNSRLSSVYKRKLEHRDIAFDNTEEIHLRSLESFAADQKIDHIHLLKIDVEGHELSVLSGAKQFIEADKIDFIQFEFGGSHIDSRIFFRDFYELLSDRYTIYRILLDGLIPIDAYNARLESFATTNYLARRKKLNK